ncbi:MAG: hypothetical protein M3Q69_00810 [Acidobacteriota bacterium]|nr:hypothetical protein [Acidobacteriota bacterium]
MSYLDPVRLHFAGQFQADPSTVNNVTAYYDNVNFKKAYQEQRPGMWNPEGSGAWRLVNCVVTRVCYADGTSTTDPSVDPVVGMSISDANKRVSGKLVDLDPQQQMVSEVWGLIVRLTDGTTDFFSGQYKPTAFTNLWQRAMVPGHKLQQPLSAIYQSVLAPLQWGASPGSRFLDELRAASTDDMLSIKWNVDGYDRNWELPTFTLGRIVGTIGPARAAEPQHFILGRQLGPSDAHMNFMPCVVDKEARRITADFGNSIATHTPGGTIMDIGQMALSYFNAGNSRFTNFASVDYMQPGWYESTAGVQAYPLDDKTLAAIAAAPIAVTINGQPFVQENVDGVYVRADQFVYRLSPGETADVQLYATAYGELQDGAPIVVNFDSSAMLRQARQNDPVPGQPTSVITGFDPNTPLIAKNGRAVLQLTAGSFETPPRAYVDGQVYGVRPLPQVVANNTPGAWVNSSDFISLLVWEPYEAAEELTWEADMQPIFTQYGNLYPLMDKIVDLTSYDDVAAHASILAFVFGLPVSDPNSMPVTRDLSPAKREAVLRWLQTPGPDGLPLRGTKSPQQKNVAAAAMEMSAEAAPPAAQNDANVDRLFLMKSGIEDEE